MFRLSAEPDGVPIMFKVIALAAALAGIAVAPAAAQSFERGPQAAGDWGRGGPGWDGNDGGYQPRGDFRGRDRYDVMPPWQLARTLRYQGFLGAEILNRREGVTIVRASSRGRDFVLVVDSRSGDVLRARPAGPSWNGGYGGRGPDWQRW